MLGLRSEHRRQQWQRRSPRPTLRRTERFLLGVSISYINSHGSRYLGCLPPRSGQVKLTTRIIPTVVSHIYDYGDNAQ